MAEKILLDTDIGSDIDDAICLAYLLAQPKARIIGVTTVSGEPQKRAQMISAQARVAGMEFPIYVGAEQPLLIPIRQAVCQQAEALDRWPHATGFHSGEAIEFMRKTIRQNPGEVTLLAIGPLTNVALLFKVDPEIPGMLKQLILMNGYFLGEDRFPEWNVLLDPHASEIVYRSRPPVFKSIGLDVTLQVTMQAEEVRQRFDTPLLRPVLDFAEVWFRERPEITFHDPLAATVIFDDTICEFQHGAVSIDLSDDEQIRGKATWIPGDGYPVQVAVGVNPKRFFEHFFGVFQ